MFQTSITKEEIAELSQRFFEGEIILVDNLQKFERAIPSLLEQKVLGFDTESRPSFKKGRTNHVALLQLATSKVAYLFRINKIGVPPEIGHILSNPDIIKVGVAIKDDLSKLHKIREFKPDGFIELQKFVKNYQIENSGLKNLAAIVLGIRISKSQQLSNWESDVLTYPQQVYAATDAWVGYEIYQKLLEQIPVVTK